MLVSRYILHGWSPKSFVTNSTKSTSESRVFRHDLTKVDLLKMLWLTLHPFVLTHLVTTLTSQAHSDLQFSWKYKKSVVWYRIFGITKMMRVFVSTFRECGQRIGTTLSSAVTPLIFEPTRLRVQGDLEYRRIESIIVCFLTSHAAAHAVLVRITTFVRFTT